ncbi:MAG: ACP S-malonyltransferase [Deltaproteobacteria bacterium]|nr:ACP S-malonyltransferase [Deltaproteobacteria bacterium]
MTSSKTALLFSGQGAQEIGMGRGLAESNPEIMDLWKKAEKISRIPLRGLYWEGGENLDNTRNLQPALVTANIGLWMALAPHIKPSGAAGHSLGEYCALAAASVLGPEQILELVSLRGRLMAEADPEGKGGMAAILKLDLPRAEEAVKLALEACANGQEVLILANYNTPSQFVASGSRQALECLASKARELKGRVLPLAVSGAFHSPLMEEAAREMSLAINKCAFSHPRFPVYCNVNGRAASRGEEIKSLLLRQMTSSVYWIDTVRNLFNDGMNMFVECSPKNVLARMVEQILSPPVAAGAYDAFTVSCPDDVADFVRRMQG